MNSHLEIIRQTILEAGLEGDAPMIWSPGFSSDIAAILTGNLNVLTIFSGGAKAANEPISEAIQRVDNEPIPLKLRTSILSELAVGAQSQGAQQIASGGIETLGHLYRLEQDALNEVNRGIFAEVNSCLHYVYGQQELPLHVEWEPLTAFVSAQQLAETIRKHLYPFVQDLTGLDIAEMAYRESSARWMREQVFRLYCEHVTPAQKERDKKGRLRYLISGSAYYHHHTFSERATYSHPTEHFNSLVKSYIWGTKEQISRASKELSKPL